MAFSQQLCVFCYFSYSTYISIYGNRNREINERRAEWRPHRMLENTCQHCCTQCILPPPPPPLRNNSPKHIGEKKRIVCFFARDVAICMAKERIKHKSKIPFLLFLRFKSHSLQSVPSKQGDNLCLKSQVQRQMSSVGPIF